MKVLLINPPSPFLIDQAAFPPLSLLYLGAALREAGVEVKVVDLCIGNRNWVGFDPDFIGITGLTAYVPYLRNLIPMLKAMHPNAKIILGGPHFTHVPLDAYRLGADYVVIGDGEAAIVNIVLGHNDSPVYYGEVCVDEWLKPDRSLIDLHEYHYEIAGQRATSIITGRGCPYQCGFCSRTKLDKQVRPLAFEKVDEELQDIHDQGFYGLMIYDDEFNLSINRMRDLAPLIGSYGFDWRCFVRSNLFNAQQAQLLAANGCAEVCTGLESADNSILHTLNKRSSAEDAASVVRLAHEHGMSVKVFSIIGLPGESEESARKLKDWIVTNRPDAFDVCPFVPYPGSDIFNHPEKYDIKLHDDYWDAEHVYKGKPGEYKVRVSTSNLSRERIGELRDEIEQECRGILSWENE